MGELPSLGARIKPLSITRRASRQIGCHKHLKEGPGYEALTCGLPISLIWRDGANQDHEALLYQQASDFGDAPDVFTPIRSRKSEITI